MELVTVWPQIGYKRNSSRLSCGADALIEATDVIVVNVEGVESNRALRVDVDSIVGRGSRANYHKVVDLNSARLVVAVGHQRNTVVGVGGIYDRRTRGGY